MGKSCVTDNLAAHKNSVKSTIFVCLASCRLPATLFTNSRENTAPGSNSLYDSK